MREEREADTCLPCCTHVTYICTQTEIARQEHGKDGYLGGRTPGRFSFLLSILYTIRTCVMNIFFLKIKKRKGGGSSKTGEQPACSSIHGNPGRQLNDPRS